MFVIVVNKCFCHGKFLVNFEKHMTKNDYYY